MSTPYWEPLVAAPLSGGGSSLPPVVNGQWLKGVGGAAVWAPLAIVNADVAAGAAIDGSKINPVFPVDVTVGRHVLASSGQVNVGTQVVFVNNAPGQGVTWLTTDGGYGHVWRNNATGRLELVSQGSCPPPGGGTNSVMSFQRHPYGGDRHTESGTLTVSSGGTSVAFTDAFASAPAVVAVVLASSGSGASATPGTPTTTGVTLYMSGISSAGCCWHAEGPD